MKQKPVYSTVKVGLLTIVALSVLVSTVIWLRGRGVTGGQHFQVTFNDVDGMRVGAPVQYMGMRVGFIDELKPEVKENQRYCVIVKFTLNEPGLEIPQGSTLSIQQSGFIGEKFLEITPPRLRSVVLRAKSIIPGLQIGVPLVAEFQDGIANIGVIRQVNFSKSLDISNPDELYAYKVAYWITQPGLDLPESVHISVLGGKAGETRLKVEDPHFLLVKHAQSSDQFVVQDPLRIKTFLEKQLASANSLQQTNEKINELMSEQTIESIQQTVKNTEILTAKANQVLTHGDQLFVAARQDLSSIVKSANQLSSSISQISNNVNDIVGHPKFKAELFKTVENVERSTTVLTELIESSELKSILSDTKVTSENAAVVMARLRKAMIEDKLPEKVDQSITDLNRSLDSLSSILVQLDEASKEDQSLKKIVTNAKTTSENLRKFSKKLNGHFLLFRLLF